MSSAKEQKIFNLILDDKIKKVITAETLSENFNIKSEISIMALRSCFETFQGSSGGTNLG